MTDQKPQEPVTPAPEPKHVITASSLRQKEALAALVVERKYQEIVWNAKTTITEGKHSVTEFLAYIRNYADQALHTLSREAEQISGEKALHEVRKIGALALAAMEQNGVRERVLPTAEKKK